MTDLSQMKEDWTEFYEILQISLQKKQSVSRFLGKKFPFTLPSSPLPQIILVSSSPRLHKLHLTRQPLQLQLGYQYRTTVKMKVRNPLHPNISMHILHTVLYTFPTVLTRRICLTIKSFSGWQSFPLFSCPF